MEALLFWGGLAAIIFFVVRAKMRKKAKWAALPKDGPMKVSIEEDYLKPGTFNSNHVPCGLKIDVTLSQNDWRALHSAGLMKKVLFTADGPSGQRYDPENTRDWHVEDLQRPTYASFWDADRMQNAKEQLLKSLHDLRDHIDARRYGTKKETFEI